MARALLILPSLALLGLAVAPARAQVSDPNLHVGSRYSDCWVEFAPELTQDAFHRFVREFGSVSAFKAVASPATLGRHGVAVAIQQINFSVEEKSDAWNDTFAHPNHEHPLGTDHSFPIGRARYGVTDRLDVGAYYTRNPNANYGWFGLEATYGALQQSEKTPISLALRGAYTRTLYVQDMDMNAFTGDITAGRTLWKIVAPYAGLGGDLVLAHETSPVVSLQNETQFVPHVIGGLEARYWHMGIGAEANWGALSSYQIQVSAMF